LFDTGADCVKDVAVLDDVVEVFVAGYDAGESAVVGPKGVAVGCFLPLV